MTASESEDSRAFLQQRVARFGLMTALLNLVFLVYQLVLEVVLAKLEFEYALKLNLIATLACTALWRVASGRALAERSLRALEVSTFLVVSTVYLLMGGHASAVGKPDLTMVLALTLGLVLRCIYVPSSARLTALLAGAVGVPLVVTSYLLYARVTPQALEVLHGVYHDAMGEKRHGGMNVATFATISSVYSGVWWLACGAVCTATSHVVHGLRREVRTIRRLGQYVLEEELGEGGMGVVYRASHALLRRPTAIKLLRPERSGAESIARFEREVRRTASLTHPNTVTVFDYGRTPNGVFYYAMELLDGATLADVVELDGPQPEARVVHVLVAASAALAEAHALGLIHRDIKPQNIMLCERGRVPDVVKVLDFGLVKEVDRGGDAELTGDQRLMGTPLYMSPESISAPESLDARSDLYALGAVGYYLVTGKHVFSGGSVIEICAQHLHGTPVPPHERLGKPIVPELEALLLACLEKDPNKRPQTADELAARLAGVRVASWSVEAARAWWEARGPELRALRKRPPAEMSRTIAVDLEARRG